MKNCITLALIAVAGVAARPCHAVTTGFLFTYNDPTITNSDMFGASVALDGNHIVIGAPGDDTNGDSTGQAHLFDAATGDLVHTFNDPSIDTRPDIFGTSVAVHGNHVLIGDPFDSTNGIDRGQAHLFDASNGNLINTFSEPNSIFSTQFGESVAVEGNRVLIGNRRDTFLGTRQVYLFDSSGSLLHTLDAPTALLSPPGVSSEAKGISVALDGNYAVVGITDDNINIGRAGIAYIFDVGTGELLHTLNDPAATNTTSFGISVDVDGKNVLVGARRDDTNGRNVGRAHLFDAITGSLVRTFDSPTIASTTPEHFGTSVSLDGNYALIGASFDSTDGSIAGRAHLFDISTGELLQNFMDPTVTSVGFFGESVDIAGGNALVGVPGDDTNGISVGQAHLFKMIVPEPNSAFLLVGMSLAVGSCRRRYA